VRVSLIHPVKSQKGFSIIELMVGLALSMVVLVGISAVYVAAKQSFRYQETSGRIQEDAGFALDSMARDIRMAGYAGCMGIDKQTTPSVAYFPASVMSSASPNGFNGLNPLAQISAVQSAPNASEVAVQPLTPWNFIRGFDNTVPSGMVAVSAPTPVTNSDSIFVAGASPRSVALNAVMASASASPTFLTDTFGWATATANSGVYDFVISNCTASTLFKGKVTSSGGVFSIDHSTAMGNASPNFSGSVQFGTDASVMPAEWHYYYIATRAGASTPSLYHVYYNGNSRQAAEELVSNVEAMKIQYGENTGTATSPTGVVTPTLLPDVWRSSASNVSDWSKIVAVRVGLMMVSDDQSANQEVTQSVLTLLGANYSVPAGASASRVRKEFSTTIVLRNRVAPR